jgi:hypothetical protein
MVVLCVKAFQAKNDHYNPKPGRLWQRRTKGQKYLGFHRIETLRRLANRDLGSAGERRHGLN